jgi:hypothetical protein
MILNQDGKIQSRYCKRTWCSVCSPIRTAVRINNYREALEALGDLQLTTLTLPNCPAEDIRPTFNRFRQIFRQYRNTRAKQGLPFRGVYNFECTHNVKTGFFHPHIHIIHEAVADEIKPIEWHSGRMIQGEYKDEFYNDLCVYWIAKNPGATMKAQDTRRCTDLIEGFKYQSLSIFKLKVNGKKVPIIPVEELDKIYQAIAGLRCFTAFGIKKISDIDEEKQMEELTAYLVEKPDGTYHWKDHDWQHGGRPDIKLSDFIPDKKLISYFETLTKNEHYKPTT